MPTPLPPDPISDVVTPLVTPLRADSPPVTVLREDPLADSWGQLVQDAVSVIRAAVQAPLDDSMTEERYRAHRVRMLGADRILGFRRGGLPMPTPGVLRLGRLDVTDGDRTIRLRWADGRPVVLPLHDPQRRDLPVDSPRGVGADDDDDE